MPYQDLPSTSKIIDQLSRFADLASPLELEVRLYQTAFGGTDGCGYRTTGVGQRAFTSGDSAGPFVG